MERGEPIEETPELSELLQQDPATLSVPVRVKGAITGYRLPNRYVQHTTDSVGAEYVNIAPGTEKRARGLLISHTEDVYINDKSAGEGMLWPKLVPFPFTHTRPVFVKAALNATTVGMTLELWAD